MPLDVRFLLTSWSSSSAAPSSGSVLHVHAVQSPARGSLSPHATALVKFRGDSTRRTVYDSHPLPKNTCLHVLAMNI